MPNTDYRRQQDKTRVDKIMQAVARTHLGGWLFVNVFPIIDRRLIPISRGRLKVAMGQPILLLHTRGARSGEPRATPLLYTPCGDAVIVVASKAGAQHHPAWYHNIRQHPDDIAIETAGTRVPVRARVVTAPNGRGCGSAPTTTTTATAPIRCAPPVVRSRSSCSSPVGRTAHERVLNARGVSAHRPVGACHDLVMGNQAQRSVLIVDDEPTIVEVVARYLERAGYITRTAANGEQALEAAARERPDLVVLDLMMPGIDGLRVMRRLRDQASEPVGVILLTARGEESDRVTGLRLGADDYVVKPFSPVELVARVDAVLRRVEKPSSEEAPVLELGEIRIDPVARQVFARGEEVLLTQREFDVLLFMARHPLQVFSREQLMDAVWQYSFYTDTSTVTVHIRRLRAKLEADPSRPAHIQTVWGLGYRFAP